MLGEKNSFEQTNTIGKPRYGCAIAALYTAIAIPGVVPITHCGPGCVDKQSSAFSVANGMQGGGGAVVPSVNAGEKEIVFGGVGNILDYPQYSERSKARDFLNMIETKDKLYSMLDSTADMEFSIRIGHENGLEEFRDMSVVTATYRVGDETVGSYGIIGPTRMDYAKVVSVLHYVGKNLNDILTCFLDEGK